MATDIDLILLEFGPHQLKGRSPIPAAFVDYKLGLYRTLTAGEEASLSVIAECADRADIPGFLVRYATEPWRFIVEPLTARATGMTKFSGTEVVSERAFVRFLWSLRGLELDQELADQLSDSIRRVAA